MLSLPLHLWANLVAYGTAVSLSPLHIGLLLLLLLGQEPLRRASWFVLSWMLTILAMLALFLSLGHRFLPDSSPGAAHGTITDLLAAGALLALGLHRLLSHSTAGAEPPDWTHQLDRFGALPLPLLIAISSGLEAISPDDLFLVAKSASNLLAAGLRRPQELLGMGVLTVAASHSLLLPLGALALNRHSILPRLEQAKKLLYANGDLLVGGLSLGLAGYLGWQGITGLA